MRHRLGSDAVRRRSSDLIELANRAGAGETSWFEFTRALTSVVPGSTSVFLQDIGNPESASVVQHGFDPDLLKAYNAHFEPLNPWNAFWASARTGRVYRSSQAMPARSFRTSEFYNDWLDRLDGRHDGIGLKLSVSGQISMMLSLQLPDTDLSEAETCLEPLLYGIAGALTRSVSLHLLCQRDRLSHAAAAALVDRSPDMAFAVDQHFQIIEANGDGAAALREAGVVRSKNNRLAIGNDAAQRWLQKAARALIFRSPLAEHQHYFHHQDDVFRMSVFLVPEQTASTGFLFYRYLIVVLIRNIMRPKLGLDHAALRLVFGLSHAEIRMCEALVAGLPLGETGQKLGITYETARDRLKRIFQKTGTRRQAELVQCLARFS